MNDLVSPQEIATNELSNADCLQLVSHSSLTQVFSQLSLWEKECQIDSHTSSSKFKAAALWHDLRQLLATKPRLSWARNDLPEFLESCFHFAKEITALVKRYFLSLSSMDHGKVAQRDTARVIASLKHCAISELHPLTCVGGLAEEVAAKLKCTA